MPTAEFPPEMPFTLHVTAKSGLPVPDTFAVKDCEALVATFADGGAMLTETSL